MSLNQSNKKQHSNIFIVWFLSKRLKYCILSFRPKKSLQYCVQILYTWKIHFYDFLPGLLAMVMLWVNLNNNVKYSVIETENVTCDIYSGSGEPGL